MTNVEYLKSLPDIAFEHYLKDVAEECFNHDGRYGICNGLCGECFEKWLFDEKEMRKEE